MFDRVVLVLLIHMNGYHILTGLNDIFELVAWIVVQNDIAFKLPKRIEPEKRVYYYR